MISQSPTTPTEEVPPETPFCIVLARYGVVPQVARFGVSEIQHEAFGDQLQRGVQLVVQTDRGPEIAWLLEVVRDGILSEEKPVTGNVLRVASSADLGVQQDNRRTAEVEYIEWQQRLNEWQLQLQLIDVEWTLDREQVILYVLSGQNAETTRLALLAAAAGLGIIHVQPVAAEGIVPDSGGGGGCGSGGCGSGGCGS